MKPTEIVDILDLAKKARAGGHIFNPLFISAPGLGKTEITQQWAKEQGLKSIVISLSNCDPPDFKGFPITQIVNGRQRLSFATPDFWPDEGEGIIILEELNRAPTSIIQCMLSLTDARRGFDGYKLPEGWLVAGCINPENAEYDVNTLDPAVKDRFEMFNIVYDKAVAVDFMRHVDYHKDIINFIDANIFTYVLPGNLGNTPGAKYNSPRTFSKLNAVLQTGFKADKEKLLFDTILGANVGKSFYEFRHNLSPVTVFDLKNSLGPSLKKLKKYSDPENYQGGLISLTVKDIIEDASITNELLADVLRTIPVGAGTSLLQDLGIKRGDKQGELLVTMCTEFPDLKALFKSVINYGK